MATAGLSNSSIKLLLWQQNFLDLSFMALEKFFESGQHAYLGFFWLRPHARLSRPSNMWYLHGLHLPAGMMRTRSM